MRALLLRDVREEIVSLLDESTAELLEGSSEVAVSMLLEAQFLLCDAIQNELNSIRITPPLVPLAGESVESATVETPPS
jgi:hypothetical protein